MKITPLTIIICIFASVGLVRLLQRVARDGIALRSASIWIITWTSLALFSIFPDLLNELVAAAGMENRLFFVLIIAVMALTAIVFNLTSRMDRLNRDIGLVIRELAIANYRVDKMKPDSPGASERSSGPLSAPDEAIGNDVISVRQHSLDHGG
jgi:hypothetical protein